MKNSKLITYSFIHAAGVVIYTAAIAWFLFNAESLFGQISNFAGPLAMLLLLVISATITGLLVLGKPVLLYLDNAKKEALIMLFYTIGWLALMTVIVFITIALS